MHIMGIKIEALASAMYVANLISSRSYLKLR